jgi:hypothetical protein
MIMKKIIFTVISGIKVILLLLFLTGQVNGQDAPAAVNLEMTTWKYADGSRTLVAKVTFTGETGEVPAAGLKIDYFNTTGNGENQLGSAQSGVDGKAILTIPASEKLGAGTDGVMKFVCRFDGNERFEAAEAETEAKDARIEISFSEADSVRKIMYKGFIRNDKGEEVPMVNSDVYLFVPRMFSMLKFQDGWLGEDGTGESDFPSDITGDSLGVVRVFARIEESTDYGNLEASAETGWAQPMHHERREGPQRELWTPIAPLWMIITLIIMLAGVWGHYFYAIIQLVFIYKAGKIKEEKSE